MTDHKQQQQNDIKYSPVVDIESSLLSYHPPAKSTLKSKFVETSQKMSTRIQNNHLNNLEGYFNSNLLTTTQHILDIIIDAKHSDYVCWKTAYDSLYQLLMINVKDESYITRVYKIVSSNKKIHDMLIGETIRDQYNWLSLIYDDPQINTSNIVVLLGDSFDNMIGAFVGLYRISIVHNAYTTFPELHHIIQSITQQIKPSNGNFSMETMIPMLRDKKLRSNFFKLIQNSDDEKFNDIMSNLQLILETVDPQFKDVDVSNLFSMLGVGGEDLKHDSEHGDKLSVSTEKQKNQQSSETSNGEHKNMMKAKKADAETKEDSNNSAEDEENEFTQAFDSVLDKLSKLNPNMIQSLKNGNVGDLKSMLQMML